LEKDNHLVIFLEEKNGYQAECMTFTQLKHLFEDESAVYYECQQGLNDVDYANNSQLERYLRIPTVIGSILVSYDKLMILYQKKQNIIFMRYEKTLKNTISHSVSHSNNRFSGYHCQEGSEQKLYTIFWGN